MHTKEANPEIDQSVLSRLREEIITFIQDANANLANAKLRIPDLEIDRQLAEEYSLMLRDELGPRFNERLYFVTVSDYTGRNGRRFADVAIEMKRGLLI